MFSYIFAHFCSEESPIYHFPVPFGRLMHTFHLWSSSFAYILMELGVCCHEHQEKQKGFGPPAGVRSLIKKNHGISSGRVLLCASAKSTSRCAVNFWGRREVTCLVIITKPWKWKTEEKKSRVLSKMKKFQKIYRSHRDALTFSG
jgi:hypothetical protein